MIYSFLWSDLNPLGIIGQRLGPRIKTLRSTSVLQAPLLQLAVVSSPAAISSMLLETHKINTLLLEA